MGEKAKSGQAQGKPAPEGLPHGFIAGDAVAAPVDGEFLSACGGGSGEEAGIFLALAALERFKNRFVIEIGVIVVHPVGVGAVKVGHFRGNPLAEVGFDGVHA